MGGKKTEGGESKFYSKKMIKREKAWDFSQPPLLRIERADIQQAG